MARFEVWYADDQGNRIAPVYDVAGLQYVIVSGDVGAASISFPRRGQLYDDSTPDRRLHIYRISDTGTTLELTCFLNEFTIETDDDGLSLRSSGAVDLNDLLRRRIVAYYAGSAQAYMSGNADDVMKEIVRDNFVDNADYSGTPNPARDVDDYGLSVASNDSAGASLEMGFSWRIVLNTLQDLQASSRAAGTEAFFGIVPLTETTMEFRTWTGQPGNDRTADGNSPIVFSPEWGNLRKPSIRYDYTKSANYIYAGGRGEESNRVIGTASDGNRAGVSVFGRREAFARASRATSQTAAVDVAENELALSRPKLILSGELLDTPLTPYGGSGWRVGDRVTVRYAGYEVNTIVRSVRVKVNADGRETITARIEDTVTD